MGPFLFWEFIILSQDARSSSLSVSGCFQYFFSSLPCPRLTDKNDKVKSVSSPLPPNQCHSLRSKTQGPCKMPGLCFLYGVVRHNPACPNLTAHTLCTQTDFSFEKPFLSCFPIKIPLLQRFLYLSPYSWMFPLATSLG